MCWDKGAWFDIVEMVTDLADRYGAKITGLVEIFLSGGFVLGRVSWVLVFSFRMFF